MLKILEGRFLLRYFTSLRCHKMELLESGRERGISVLKVHQQWLRMFQLFGILFLRIKSIRLFVIGIAQSYLLSTF